VTNILAKKTLDALSKFLNAIDIVLLHSPGSIWRIRWSRLEFPDLFLYPEIPRYVRDQIFDHRKSLHRLDGDWFIDRQIAQPRHAHQFGHSVNFRRTRTALARFTIPSAGEIVGLRGLNVIDRIEHDHPLGNAGRVITEFASPRIATPDFENCGFHSLKS